MDQWVVALIGRGDGSERGERMEEEKRKEKGGLFL